MKFNYRLSNGTGGTVIDNDGALSAVECLRETYGDRLDWKDLLESFEERAAVMTFDGGLEQREAESRAIEIVRKIAAGRMAA